LNNNTDYAFIKEFENKISNNYFFFFWGHSLDVSDQDYLNEVFDFINELKTKTKKIIIIYHNEESKSKLLLNILNVRGKKDIQDLMRSQVLQFINIDSKELQKELNRDITVRTITSTIIAPR
jgi:NAD-dependent SIR2 family protein deacetylase